MPVSTERSGKLVATADKMFDLTIEFLDYSIGLWMIRSRSGMTNLMVCHECCEFVTEELRSIVRDDFFRRIVCRDDMIEELRYN